MSRATVRTREGTGTANGIRIRWTEAGDGPLVLLLHGFPDHGASWREQLPALAQAGVRAVAPDLRGYGGTERPHDVAAYDLDVLAADVVALVERLGEGRARGVVGHDWGGAIAWHVAMHHPDRLERLAILNAPHPATFARALRSPLQHVRSAYVYLAQLPWLPERAVSMRDGWLLRRAMRRMVQRPGALDEEALRAQVAAVVGDDRARAPLAYYRAAVRRMLRGRRGPVGMRGIVEHPTLVLWGDRDPVLRPGLTEGLERWVPQVRVQRFPGAGHWVHWDAAEAVSLALSAFLRDGSRSPAPRVRPTAPRADAR